MKKYIIILAFISMIMDIKAQSNAVIQGNGWTIKMNPSTKKLTYTYKGNTIITDAYSKALVNQDTVYSQHYKSVKLASKTIDDNFGRGKRYALTYSDPTLPTLIQYIYVYPGKDYLITELVVKTKKNSKTNYLAPICSDGTSSFLPTSESNRALRVPFDNDAFVHYLAQPLDRHMVSFEVSAIFNGQDRQGLVIGSITHDTWKTGIKYVGKGQQEITNLEVFGGITHELTRDISDHADRPSAYHGKISGTVLQSPKIFIGYFDDWRKGMETYADANAIISPPKKWDKGTPFGWNSWAAMAKELNYEGAIDVSDFFKQELQPNGFENNGTSYIVLDSFWDNFTPEQLREYVEHCHKNGQKAGIYWCPFSDWIGNAETFVEGTNGEYKYKDAYLYSNGKPRKIESLAMDPTHPATQKRIDHFIGMFKKLGYSYVKIDFINNGALEADKFYNPKVTTGIQAYNEGMHYLQEACADSLFMALSIAPTFPSQYAESKKISCDAWGAMTEGDWGTTGYMLNSLSFGWWLDRVYPMNDADHVLLHKEDEDSDYQDGSNRARITSAAITGVLIIGDNLSTKGTLIGSHTAREKARAYTTNEDINNIARLGKSFYPVEGYMAPAPQKAERMFMYETDNEVYVAIFNFNKNNNEEGLLPFNRLNLRNDQIAEIKELWSNSKEKVQPNNLAYTVKPQDVSVYKITKK